MASLNKVMLIGNLTADPELKTTQTGISVTTFTIAVQRRFARQQAEGQQTADFVNIVAWRQSAEFVCKYFAKGRPILVCGSIQTRTWTDQANQKRYVTEVVADEVGFVDSKPFTLEAISIDLGMGMDYSEVEELCRKLDALLRTLYHGSRLEKVRRAECADKLYLAVPAHVMDPDELGEEWGLIYVYPDGRTELIREAEKLPCSEEARRHLALNIASAAKANVLFSNGICGGHRRYRCTRLPKRRRK